MERKSNKAGTSRRSVLKTVGIGSLATVSLSGVSSMSVVASSEESNERKADEKYKRRVDSNISASHRRILQEKKKRAQTNVETADISPQNIGVKSLWLGNDASLDAKYGGKGKNKEGFSHDWISGHDAGFDTSNNDAYAQAAVNHGEGSLTAWAYLGRSVQVENDSGHQEGTVTFRGSLNGALGGDSGNPYVHVKMTVEDLDQNQSFNDMVFQKSGYIGGIDEPDLVNSMQVDFEAGHLYGVKVELMAEVTATDVIESNVYSIFHPKGTGSPHLDWGDVDITFP